MALARAPKLGCTRGPWIAEHKTVDALSATAERSVLARAVDAQGRYRAELGAAHHRVYGREIIAKFIGGALERSIPRLAHLPPEREREHHPPHEPADDHFGTKTARHPRLFADACASLRVTHGAVFPFSL